MSKFTQQQVEERETTFKIMIIPRMLTMDYETVKRKLRPKHKSMHTFTYSVLWEIFTMEYEAMKSNLHTEHK